VDNIFYQHFVPDGTFSFYQHFVPDGTFSFYQHFVPDGTFSPFNLISTLFAKQNNLSSHTITINDIYNLITLFI